MEKEWFEDWFASPYHDLLYEKRNEDEASFFVNNLLKYLQPVQGASMLDVACGEGRFAIQLAARSFEVIGIDLEEKRINEAKKSETDQLKFYVQDMRVPFRINYFDYVFNFYTSFGYFENPHDNLLAARSFAMSLKPGGILLIDYFNKEKIVESLISREEVQKEEVRFVISRNILYNKVVKTICVYDGNDVHHYQEKVSLFSLHDFETLFSQCGMYLKHVFGNYQLDRFDATSSDRMIMLWEKR